jgi:hypothetical protein
VIDTLREPFGHLCGSLGELSIIHFGLPLLPISFRCGVLKSRIERSDTINFSEPEPGRF